MKFRNFIYDAASGLSYLVSKLTHIESKMYEKKYKAITYMRMLPVSNEAGEYAESVTYFFMDGKAVAEFVGTHSLNVPISEIGTDKVVVPVELGSVGYQYSDEELRQSMALGRPLQQLKANTARRGYEEKAQTVAMTGDAAHNLPGFINNTNVTASTVLDPGSGTTWIGNKTPAQILFDINDLFSDVFTNSLQNEMADTLGLPTAQWSYIASTPRSDNSDTTILAWLVANSPYLESVDDVIPTPELKGAGAGGTDRMIAYTKDPDKVVFHIPMPLRFTEPQRDGRGYTVPGEFKLSGVEFRFPGSAQYGDGI